MSAVANAQTAVDNLNQGGSALTAAQTDFENAVGTLREAARIVADGDGTGGQLAGRAQLLVDEAQKLFGQIGGLTADVEEWITTLQS